MRNVHTFLVAVLVLGAVAGAGCGSSPGEGGQLEGTRWVLESYLSGDETRDVPGTASVDALFEDGTVSGSSGVNSYSGGYELSGSKLTIGRLASTLMAGPQELMDLEQAYVSALEQTASFTASEQELTLYDEDGGVLLKYSKGI